MPLEPTGGPSDPNYWGRHVITNREDRRSTSIPGQLEEYHPVPSPERRKQVAEGDVPEKGATPTGEVSPDTERRLLDEANSEVAGTPANQLTGQPGASTSEGPAATSEEPAVTSDEQSAQTEEGMEVDPEVRP